MPYLVFIAANSPCHLQGSILLYIIVYQIIDMLFLPFFYFINIEGMVLFPLVCIMMALN